LFSLINEHILRVIVDKKDLKINIKTIDDGKLIHLKPASIWSV